MSTPLPVPTTEQLLAEAYDALHSVHAYMPSVQAEILTKKSHALTDLALATIVYRRELGEKK
jgi:hypothetical protein